MPAKRNSEEVKEDKATNLYNGFESYSNPSKVKAIRTNNQELDKEWLTQRSDSVEKFNLSPSAVPSIYRLFIILLFYSSIK